MNHQLINYNVLITSSSCETSSKKQWQQQQNHLSPSNAFFHCQLLVMACDDTTQSELRYCKEILSLLLRLQITQSPPQQ